MFQIKNISNISNIMSRELLNFQSPGPLPSDERVKCKDTKEWSVWRPGVKLHETDGFDKCLEIRK